MAKSTRVKTTLDMNGIFKPKEQPISKKEETLALKTVSVTVEAEQLKVVWEEYAEKRKNQIAEYQILTRIYQYEYPKITMLLTNAVEETLLENFRHEFVQFLRDRLKNTDLHVQSILQEATGKKIIYTSREKFEHLAEKNPYLNELKERLGLDWDY